ncbi:hypothetical protein [Rhizobium lusitanum]|jgi:hypothetical protein|nr:hypothetical protein [Rhizobium lusitanum]NTJ05537.1 hypothetical protein [Rhizobium lusitanum]
MFSVPACIRDDHEIGLIFVAVCLIGSLATMLLLGPSSRPLALEKVEAQA